MKDIIQQHLHIVAKMRKNPITVEQIETVYRKSSNLRDVLLQALLIQNQNKIPCRDTRSLTCDRITYSNSVTSSDNVTLKISGNYNCQNRNCIYSVTYNCCGKKYIGLNSQTINMRMKGHKNHIRYWKKTPQKPSGTTFWYKELR